MNRPKSLHSIRAYDAFCGAGGFSEALAEACFNKGVDISYLLCANHWDKAIATHTGNHPYADHHNDRVESITDDMIQNLQCVLASPECTHFSTALGGKPINDQRRIPAGTVPDHIRIGRPEFFVIENVPEFATWGPLYSKDHKDPKKRNRPIPSKKGTLFMSNMIEPLRSMGYGVDWRVLNAADYGDPTTRKRLFIIGCKAGRTPEWPEPTHSSDPRSGLLPWVAAKEIIDWDWPACSIFATQEEANEWAKAHGIKHPPKRPLCQKTMDRIIKGIEKYWGDLAEPFLVLMKGQSTTRSQDDPLPTLTTNEHVALLKPLLYRGQHGGKVLDTEVPMPTITANSDYFGVIEPFLTQYHGGTDSDKRHHSLEDPIPTVDCANRFALLKPLIHQQEHGGRIHDTDDPMPTVTTKNNVFSIFKPFFTKLYGTGTVEDPDNPLSAVTAGGNKHGLVNPFVIGQQSCSAPRTVDAPLMTVATGGAISVCEPFMTEYYGSGSGEQPQAISKPLPTVTCRDRFGLIRQMGIDITYRMLQPHELAAAMGFPEDYEFLGGKKDKTRMIGNAVPVNTARKLIECLLDQTILRRR